jgi:hypothetical protein
MGEGASVSDPQRVRARELVHANAMESAAIMCDFLTHIQ